MAATDRGAGIVAEASLSRLLSELIDDLGRLLRQELQLARVEMAEKLKQAEHGLYTLIAGLLAAFCALLLLLAAAVIGLSKVLPAWAAALGIGMVMALVAFLLLRQGRASLHARNLVPERTLRAGRTSRQTSAQTRRNGR